MQAIHIWHATTRVAASLSFATLLSLFALPAHADGGKDCAPIGSLPNYLASKAPERLAFETHKFLVTQKDGDNEWMPIAGRSCQQEYDLKEGAEEMSQLEVISNYQDQLDQIGAKTVYTEESHVNAVLSKDGHDTWISVGTDGSEVDVIVIDRQPVKLSLLPPSGNDYRLLGHMPDYVAGTPEKKHFDQYQFTIQGDDGDRDVMVQGAKFILEYDLKKGAPEVSDIEVYENYLAALKKLGAEILHANTEDYNELVARYDDHGQPIWMEIGINSGLDEINISVIEEKAFEATIKPPDASAMKTALDQDGHIALHVNFDFNKATLRADAAPIIAQIVALLKDNPELKLSIEGNTDNVGGHDYNVKLSQDRAASVVAALVKAGIATNRLKSSGHGPDQPVADNDSSRGRAKNRRVELVKW